MLGSELALPGYWFAEVLVPGDFTLCSFLYFSSVSIRGSFSIKIKRLICFCVKPLAFVFTAAFWPWFDSQRLALSQQVEQRATPGWLRIVSKTTPPYATRSLLQTCSLPVILQLYVRSWSLFVVYKNWSSSCDQLVPERSRHQWLAPQHGKLWAPGGETEAGQQARGQLVQGQCRVKWGGPDGSFNTPEVAVASFLELPCHLNDWYLLTFSSILGDCENLQLDNNISTSINIPEKGSELINIGWYGQSILYRF